MFAGPVQASLLMVSAVFAAALTIILFKKQALRHVRWPAFWGLSMSLVLDVIGLIVLPSHSGHAWVGTYLSVELAGSLAWLFFSTSYARAEPNEERLPPGWFSVFGVAILLGALSAGSAYLAHPIVQQTSTQSVVYTLSTLGFCIRVLSLAIMIFALTNLESTLVNSVHGQRWRIKFAILGVFTILAGGVFTISLGLLFRSLDLSLIPARQTGFILGVGLLLFSSIFRGGEHPVSVSRRLASSSIVLLGAGAYLIFLGALGIVLNVTNFAGNKALLLALGIIVGLGILTLMLSEGFRRKCNRVLQHYFYKEKYDYRVQWLSFTRRLATASDRKALYRAILLGFCETFGMGGAVLYLWNNESRLMLPVQAWEVEMTIPQMTDWTVVTDLLKSGSAAADVRVQLDGVDPNTRIFFGLVEAAFAIPLMLGGSLDGIILLTKPIDSSEEYNQEDFDLMEALATQSHLAILNHRLTDQLSKARDMEVFGKVTAFIVHDLKNLLYTLSLVVKNARIYIQNEDFQVDMLRSLENTVNKMHVLISQLRQLPSRENLHLELFDLMQLARSTFKNPPERRIKFSGESVQAFVDKDQMQKVILNLVMNACDAADDDSAINVEIGIDTSPFVRIVDNGIGMSADFIQDSLFQPFRTTKSKGMGIGLYQCKQIVQAHGGVIEVSSVPGKGTVFTVRLPGQARDAVQEDT